MEKIKMSENEQPLTELKTCDDCGQTGIKNMGTHKRFCKGKAKENVTESKDIPQQKEHEPIRISGMHQYKSPEIYDSAQCVAWFQDSEKRFFKVPEFVGILHTGTDELPCILIGLPDGTFLPPFMIAGFIGMFPQNMEWPEIEQPEPQQEEIKPEPIYEEVIQPEPERKTVKILPPEPQKVKVSLISRLLHKKKKMAQLAPETKELLQELKNATST